MQDLSRLLRPRSIAVIGGGTWCRDVIAQCRRIGFAGPVWPVHPHREEIGGLPAHARVTDLPEAPDAAFIGVNRAASIETVRALYAMGAGGAVCFASGFRESTSETGDGRDMEEALVRAAGPLRILGPNCYGFLNLLDGAALWPDQQGARRVERGVALITQSSNIAINLTMQTRGLPLAYVVTVGNQAQTGMAEIAETLLADERVTALGLYIEGVGDLAAFETMARTARARGIAVVVLKSGRTAQAQAAALSHTGALAGSDAGARALFERLGVAQVDTLSDLLETLKILHVVGPLASPRIASLSSSGGEAGLIADQAARAGLICPPLDAAQEAGLRAALGPRVALANPLDYHTYIWGDRAAIAATFSAMMAGDLALGVVILDFPRPDRCDGAAWHIVIDAVADTMAATGRPMAILSSLLETMPESVAEAMIARGIVPLCGMAEGVAAMAAAARCGVTRAHPRPLAIPAPTGSDSHLLSEAEAKTRLAAQGVSVPRAATAHSPEEAAQAATALGFPVVLKALGIAHKTEAGAVALDLACPEAVATAATRMGAAAFLIEEMITGGVAELLVGVIRDPAHGFVLTLGAGGVLTERLADTVSLLLPSEPADIRAALDRLRIAPLLHGYRGARGADLDALVAAIGAVQTCALAHQAQLHELEINPLIATPERAIALDALFRLGGNP